MKMQKSVIFAKKNMKTNTWNIKNIEDLEIIVIMQGNKDMLCKAFVI